MRTRTMRRVAAFATVLSLACLTCGEAFALKLLCRVTPQNAGDFEISVQPAKAGDAMAITVSRDRSQAKSFPADSELTLRRDATLQVSGEAGLVIKCRLAPSIEKNRVKYQITLARDLVEHAHLTVSEIHEYKSGPQLPGGGTIYEIDLGEFAPKPKWPAWPASLIGSGWGKMPPKR